MTAAPALRVRVWVTDVWDAVELGVSPASTIGELKVAALEQATGRTDDPGDYMVKYRGARVGDEGVTVESLSVPNGAPFIVLPARRRPVR